MLAHSCNTCILRGQGRWMDPLSPGIQNQPRQRGETSSLPPPQKTTTTKKPHKNPKVMTLYRKMMV